MFEELNLSVLIRRAGIYSIKKVFRLDNSYFVQMKGGQFVKLMSQGFSSFRDTTWDNLSSSELKLVYEVGGFVLK